MALLFLGALVATGPAALADQVTMTLTGVTPSGENLGGVYTSPYEITVNGSTVLALACDDFQTDISLNQTWTANEYTLADVGNDGPQKFTTPTGSVTVYGPDESAGGTGPPSSFGTFTAYQEYYAAAVLADDLFNTKSNTQAAADYSYAIWQIFYPEAYLGYAGNELAQADRVAVYKDMDTALKAAVKNLPLGYSLNIYTPCAAGNSKNAGGCASGATPDLGASQEFISIPEGSSLPLLPFDLLALCVGLFLVRGRILRNARASN